MLRESLTKAFLLADESLICLLHHGSYHELKKEMKDETSMKEQRMARSLVGKGSLATKLVLTLVAACMAISSAGW